MTFLIALFLALISFMYEGIHEVRQGYVGMYKNFGVLQSKMAEPGYHFMVPFYQEFLEINLLVQTDVVTNIPCGTAKGILVYFDKVEIVNRLKKKKAYKTVLNYTEDYDKFWIRHKIHHQINQFCSKHTLQEIYIDIFDKLDEELIKSLNNDLKQWAPGIQIMSVRVTKPNIPDSIRKNFQKMEKTKVNYSITLQKEHVKIEEQKTIQRQQLIKWQSNLDVKEIEFQKALESKINAKKIAEIEAEILLQQTKTQIQTEFLSALAEAELYNQLYTNKYLSYLAKQAFSSNITLNVGKYIPNVSIKTQ